MNTNQILAYMAQILAQPQSWTRGASARDHQKREVRASSSTAVCWCLTGARRRVLGPDQPEPCNASLVALSGAIHARHPDRVHTITTAFAVIVAFNDHPQTTHDDILTVINLARQD